MRQLSWFGHLIRLPDDAPAKLALEYARSPTLKPRGRQKLTWIGMMEKIFSQQNISWDDASGPGRCSEVMARYFGALSGKLTCPI